MKKSPQRRTSGITDKILLSALLFLITVYTIVTLATYRSVIVQHRAAIVTATPQTTVTTAHNKNNNHRSLEDLQHHMFPLHVTEMEEIPHPGYALLTKHDNWPSDLPTTLSVPPFFDTSYGHYYFPDATFNNENTTAHDNTRNKHTIRHYLGRYGTQLLTPEQAASIGSFTTSGRETIYASVASYRDPECRATVRDLFERAEFPERIRVAIVDQRLLGSDSGDPPCIPDCTNGTAADEDAAVLCQYQSQLDVFTMDARLAVGPVFARHLAHRLYRGEYFAMQLDSHVRFTEHWDTDIIQQWKSANNEMAVLSTYLSDIIGSIDPVTHANKHPARPIMCVSDYEGSGVMKHLRHGQQPEGPPGIHGQPTLHPFWAAGFSFARGHFVIQVPYDQHLPMVFQGEEISMGLRGFTYGYDYYAAERSVCFHMYAIKENEARRKVGVLFVLDFGTSLTILVLLQSIHPLPENSAVLGELACLPRCGSESNETFECHYWNEPPSKNGMAAKRYSSVRTGSCAKARKVL